MIRSGPLSRELACQWSAPSTRRRQCHRAGRRRRRAGHRAPRRCPTGPGPAGTAYRVDPIAGVFCDAPAILAQQIGPRPKHGTCGLGLHPGVLLSVQQPVGLGTPPLWLYAMARGHRLICEVNTTEEDHAVAVPRPGPPHRKITNGRTQGGNNNAWCQDNEISWVNWEPGAEADALRAFI